MKQLERTHNVEVNFLELISSSEELMVICGGNEKPPTGGNGNCGCGSNANCGCTGGGAGNGNCGCVA